MESSTLAVRGRVSLGTTHEPCHTATCQPPMPHRQPLHADASGALEEAAGEAIAEMDAAAEAALAQERQGGPGGSRLPKQKQRGL